MMDMLAQTILEQLPALICLVIGFVLVVVEMYIPGFGLPGITGAILLIAGVALRSKSAAEALITTVVILALLLVALTVSIRSASKGRMAKSKLVNKAQIHTSKDEYNLNRLLGHMGVVRTALRPAGMVDFDGERIDVVSEGEFIAEGERVTVSHVEGNRVLVKKV